LYSVTSTGILNLSRCSWSTGI